jgi:hypothetical protein
MYRQAGASILNVWMRPYLQTCTNVLEIMRGCKRKEDEAKELDDRIATPPLVTPHWPRLTRHTSVVTPQSSRLVTPHLPRLNRHASLATPQSPCLTKSVMHCIHLHARVKFTMKFFYSSQFEVRTRSMSNLLSSVDPVLDCNTNGPTHAPNWPVGREGLGWVGRR